MARLALIITLLAALQATALPAPPTPEPIAKTATTPCTQLSLPAFALAPTNTPVASTLAPTFNPYPGQRNKLNETEGQGETPPGPAPWIEPATWVMLCYDLLSFVLFVWCWVRGYFWWWRKYARRRGGRDGTSSEAEDWRARRVEGEMRRLGML